MGSGYIEPNFLDLGTSWRWVVRFTLLPLYPRGKSPRYPLDRRLGAPQNQSGQRGEEKILECLQKRQRQGTDLIKINSYVWVLEKLILAHLVKISALMEYEISYRIHKGLPLQHVLSQMNPVHILTHSFYEIHFNIIFNLTSVSSKLFLNRLV
jgi:hypothetical protein